jgi:glycosyltransferase involved in cell wall biosynthesis
VSGLVWHSSFAAATGYSGSSLAIALELDRRGLALRPLYLYGSDSRELLDAGWAHPRIAELQRAPLRLDWPQAVYGPGDLWAKNSGAYRIGFSMLEVDGLPPSWVEQGRQLDEVWTPTAWGAELFRQAGISAPVHVVPLGVDPARFCPGPAPRAGLAERTIFVSVFEWARRKGWDLLLRAYARAFRPGDPVLLLLKVESRAPAENPARAIAELLPQPTPPIGLMVNQRLSLERLVELYRLADCLVLPTRGEGWGMPVLEAMACGTPAIATAWSGMTAFLTTENGYPLPIRGLVPTPAQTAYYGGLRWADPDEDALVDLLRRAHLDPDERRRKGRRAADDARRWSWANSADIILERLRQIGA